MKNVLLLFCIFAFVASTCVATPPTPDGMMPLFDGKTFAGWEGDMEHFRIEDGSLVCGSLKAPLSKNKFICTKKKYENFELRLKFKALGKHQNGGIQVRSYRVPNSDVVVGYQADIAAAYTGNLYDEHRRRKILAGLPEEECAKVADFSKWNNYAIRCQGPHIQLWVNGKKTADYTEKDKSIPRTGIIGLQIHSGVPSEIWYKDVVIKELPKP